ncbi:MAG: phosphatase PAP2 family protein [Patescibacteria group bacterium]
MSEEIIKFTASALIWIMFGGLFVLWVVDGKIKKEQVIHALASAVIAWILAAFIKDLFHTTRPYVVDGSKALVFWIVSTNNGAFPSGHAAASFAMAFTVWLHDKKIGFFYILTAILIGVARVLGNVHYPIDILGGATLGIFIAFVIEKIHFFEILSRLRK